MRVKKKSFEGAICDEVELAKNAKNLLQTHLQNKSLPVLNRETILELSQQYSPDFAARYFYEALLQSDYRTFIDALHRHSNEQIESIKEPAIVKIYLIPGMFYKEHPETGAGGTLALEIAEKFGFETELIPIKSGGSMSDNAKIIENKLAGQTHENIWLVSMSKGSADVRHFFQYSTFFDNADSCKKIRGWINIAGIPKGFPYADYRLSTPLKRGILRLLCKIFPVDYQALMDLKTDNPLWNKDNWPKGIEMIHVVPVPHSAHLQGFISKKYHQTLKAGPNDGLVPLTDNLDIPGYIYPVWGCDHFMRTPKMSAHIYQLFNYIVAQTGKQ